MKLKCIVMSFIYFLSFVSFAQDVLPDGEGNGAGVGNSAVTDTNPYGAVLSFKGKKKHRFKKYRPTSFWVTCVDKNEKPCTQFYMVKKDYDGKTLISSKVIKRKNLGKGVVKEYIRETVAIDGVYSNTAETMYRSPSLLATLGVAVLDTIKSPVSYISKKSKQKKVIKSVEKDVDLIFSALENGKALDLDCLNMKEDDYILTTKCFEIRDLFWSFFPNDKRIRSNHGIAEDVQIVGSTSLSISNVARDTSKELEEESLQKENKKKSSTAIRE